MLCASLASTSVEFHGASVPVCRIHDAKYARWGGQAAEQAILQWGWTEPGSQGGDVASGRPQLTPTGV